MKQKILLAMSGGVDSAVAALLLKKEGYDVTAAFMKNWSDTKNKLTGECSWRDERRMALKIASVLEIPLITLDFEEVYRKEVVEPMFKKYQKGITPNPDIDCNTQIKFPKLIAEAKKRGIDLVATGHYARIKKTKAGFELHRAKDESKDQSYFLEGISQKELAHLKFPIGDYTKVQVREIAKKTGFPNWDKKSTVGICFIGKIDLKKFLSQKIPNKKGIARDPEGKVIGEHDGVYYYTIGQRLGPRYGFELERKNEKTGKMEKLYVAKKDVRKNELIVAPRNHPINYAKKFKILHTHWISETDTEIQKITKKGVRVRIRQVGELLPGKITKTKNGWVIELKKGIFGVSEGQAAVIYQKTKTLGGGEIRF